MSRAALHGVANDDLFATHADHCYTNANDPNPIMLRQVLANAAPEPALHLNGDTLPATESA